VKCAALKKCISLSDSNYANYTYSVVQSNLCLRQWGVVSIGWQWLVDITQCLAKLSWLFVKKQQWFINSLGSNVFLDTVSRLGPILCPLKVAMCYNRRIPNIHARTHIHIYPRDRNSTTTRDETNTLWLTSLIAEVSFYTKKRFVGRQL